MLDGLIIGFVFCAAIAISLFFLKFWHSTHDQLFLAFAIVFAIEGFTRLFSLFYTSGTDRVPLINVLRLVGYFILIASIVIKNRKTRRPPT
jgi:uncharacterized protein YjeT (DUF2065 family)